MIIQIDRHSRLYLQPARFLPGLWYRWFSWWWQPCKLLLVTAVASGEHRQHWFVDGSTVVACSWCKHNTQYRQVVGGNGWDGGTICTVYFLLWVLFFFFRFSLRAKDRRAMHDQGWIRSGLSCLDLWLDAVAGPIHCRLDMGSTRCRFKFEVTKRYETSEKERHFKRTTGQAAEELNRPCPAHVLPSSITFFPNFHFFSLSRTLKHLKPWTVNSTFTIAECSHCCCMFSHSRSLMASIIVHCRLEQSVAWLYSTRLPFTTAPQVPQLRNYFCAYECQVKSVWGHDCLSSSNVQDPRYRNFQSSSRIGQYSWCLSWFSATSAWSMLGTDHTQDRKSVV